MKIYSIDPGNTQSGYAIIDSVTLKPFEFGKIDNFELLEMIEANNLECEHLVIEQIKSYGNVMGDTIIETCVWIGRFIQAWGQEFTLIPRKTICTSVCGNPRAKDKNIRRAVLDKYTELANEEFKSFLGGGKEPIVGTKKDKGVLYGISGDMYSALAVGLAYYERSPREAWLG